MRLEYEKLHVCYVFPMAADVLEFPAGKPCGPCVPNVLRQGEKIQCAEVSDI